MVDVDDILHTKHIRTDLSLFGTDESGIYITPPACAHTYTIHYNTCLHHVVYIAYVVYCLLGRQLLLELIIGAVLDTVQRLNDARQYIKYKFHTRG